MPANGKGLKSTSHRPKTRESRQWTGVSPLVRRKPYHPDHAGHIAFLMECWNAGEMGTVEEYIEELRLEGYSPDVLQSILAQATQGMPGDTLTWEDRDALDEPPSDEERLAA